MKWLVWSILSVVGSLSVFASASALPTSPSDPNSVKVNGPLIITGYSFTLNQLQYVQIYNNTDSLASLDGWSIVGVADSEQTTYASLSGLIEPHKYATVAHESVLSPATFVLDTSTIPPQQHDKVMSEVVLASPAGSLYNHEVAYPNLTLAKAYEHDVPMTIHFTRNRSATTGNYLTTYQQHTPGTVVSDPLYIVPTEPTLKIVELFPDAPTCGPTEKQKICFDYVKVYNSSVSSYDLSRFRIRTGNYGQSSTTSNTVPLSGVLGNGEYMSFPISLSASGSWVWLEDRYGLQVYESTILSYPSNSGYPERAWSYDNLSDSWRWNIYASLGPEPNNFGPIQEVNDCSGLKITELSANVTTEDQFIEVSNSTTKKINIHNCKLQTNRSAATYSFPDITLEADERYAVYVHETELTLTKMTKGTVYILSSDSVSEIDEVTYENLAENTSWAYVDGDWQQTFAATPGSNNILQAYASCQIGYERNIETGFCRKIAVASAPNSCGPGKYRNPNTNRCRSLTAETNSLQACASNQYRNPETNRCRLLTSNSSSLKSCEADQFRNPLTNRCKLLTSTASNLKPCSVGQERNPQTNRCRKTSSNISADFPVDKIMGGSTQGGLGWWAFGGVGILAAGYAGWEWRSEMVRTIRKLSRFVSSGS